MYLIRLIGDDGFIAKASSLEEAQRVGILYAEKNQIEYEDLEIVEWRSNENFINEPGAIPYISQSEAISRELLSFTN